MLRKQRLLEHVCCNCRSGKLAWLTTLELQITCLERAHSLSYVFLLHIHSPASFWTKCICSLSTIIPRALGLSSLPPSFPPLLLLLRPADLRSFLFRENFYWKESQCHISPARSTLSRTHCYFYELFTFLGPLWGWERRGRSRGRKLHFLYGWPINATADSVPGSRCNRRLSSFVVY